MVKALFDTNILIDFLNGSREAAEELGRFRDRSISVITWMEVLVGTTDENRSATEAFLNNFDVVEIDTAVASLAVTLRQRHRIKLPDALVWASAQVSALLLVTRNTKDFPADDPSIRVPYRH